MSDCTCELRDCTSCSDESGLHCTCKCHVDLLVTYFEKGIVSKLSSPKGPWIQPRLSLEVSKLCTGAVKHRILSKSKFDFAFSNHELANFDVLQFATIFASVCCLTSGLEKA